MGLARKGSRLIRLNNATFRWTVSPDDGYMVIVVESEEHAGQRMEAYVEYHEEADQSHARITPAVARRAIELALDDGWQPERVGFPPFRLLDADERVWDVGS